MKKLSLVAIIVLALPVTSQALHLKVPNQLTVCSYSEFKPISYGNGEGFEAQLVNKIAKQLKVKVKYYPEAIYEQLWAMPSKPYTLCDIAIGGFSKTAAREQQGAVFSKPSLRFSQSFLIRRQDADQLNQVTKFANHKIGVVPGTTGALYAIQRLKEAGLDWQTIIVNYPSEHELVPALKQQKIDAIGRGEIGNEYQAKQDSQFKTVLKRDFGESFRIVVDKNNPELLELINQQL